MPPHQIADGGEVVALEDRSIVVNEIIHFVRSIYHGTAPYPPAIGVDAVAAVAAAAAAAAARTPISDLSELAQQMKWGLQFHYDESWRMQVRPKSIRPGARSF